MNGHRHLLSTHDQEYPRVSILPGRVAHIPVVGDAYDLITGLAGYDFITDERLDWWARGLSVAAAGVAITGVSEQIGGPEMRVAGKLMALKIGRVAHRLATRRYVRELPKIIDEANIAHLRLPNRAIRDPVGKVVTKLRPDLVDYERGIVVELKSGAKTVEAEQDARRQAEEYVSVLNEHWRSRGKRFFACVEWSGLQKMGSPWTFRV